MPTNAGPARSSTADPSPGSAAPAENIVTPAATSAQPLRRASSTMSAGAIAERRRTSACTSASAAATPATCAATKNATAHTTAAVAPADAAWIRASVEPPVASTPATVTNVDAHATAGGDLGVERGGDLRWGAEGAHGFIGPRSAAASAR